MTNNDADRAPVYLVFGATGGIGFELCRRLAASGARLIMAARNRDKLALLSDAIEAKFIVVDATEFDDVDRCGKEALEVWGRLDGVANCVGSLLLKPAHLTSERDWYSVVSANLTSAFACVRTGAKAMMESGGSIVLVSSAASKIGMANHEAIAAAKAGVSGLVLSAAATYARYKIRVNCVAPGLVRTPLSQHLTNNELSMKASLSLHALGKLGEPADVASAMAWLLSSESSWVTGQTITIDGGLSSIKGSHGPRERTTSSS